MPPVDVQNSRFNPEPIVHESAPAATPAGGRLPSWMRRPLGGGPEFARTAGAVGRERLHTICEEARCPNRGECWNAGTATFLILGDRCTRSCGFCSVAHTRPKAIDPGEPERLASAIAAMQLRYIVITSVDRDDLPDKGAAHWAACIRAVRARNPEMRIELLTPDFRRAQAEALFTLGPLAPLVWGHNVETVPRLYRAVRPGSDYSETLALLRRASALPGIETKSSLMLGFGERTGEVLSVLDDLAAAGVRRLTIGQYLRPTPKQMPVVEYLHPRAFDWLAREARARGIGWAIAAPFARSSYRAELSAEETLSITSAEHDAREAATA